ncbi:MAG: hypothetical protein Q8N05_05430 [Bacteroidota bacterium]|nr:hypothetical protein [Bacteroidota bacterium]
MDKTEAMLNSLRERYLDILSEQLVKVELEIVNAYHRLGERESDMIVKSSIVSVLDEMMSVNALVSALKHGGEAKSIILINSSGRAVDLLSVKELKENEIFNQILDNHNLK